MDNTENTETLKLEDQRKPTIKKGVLKIDLAVANDRLAIKVHQLETELQKFREMPTIRRIVWAVTGKVF